MMDMSSEYVSMVKNKILDLSKNFECDIFLFGSRATGGDTRSSDIDVGFEYLDSHSFRTIKREFNNYWDDSRIPHQVDLVLFSETSKGFQVNAKKGRILWKEK